MRNPNSFSPTWKQSHYLSGVMTQPAGADMSRRCLMETKCINGSQNCEKSFMTLIESRFSYVNSRHIGERERAAKPALSLLKTASLHFHIYPPQKSYQHLLCTCCQAITHIYLYRFNSPLNCLFKKKKKNHFESAYSMEEKGNFSLILFCKLQKVSFNIYFICGHS